MSDIINRIDALVDESLERYKNRSGYDHNVNQDKCPHCPRPWHGLKITRHVEGMTRKQFYEEDYSHAADDSEVLCEGSGFIGPMKPPPIGNDSPPPREESRDPVERAQDMVVRLYQTIMGLL